MSKTPEELNKDTPPWFKEWHNKSFYHFKVKVENRLDLHGRLIWIVLATIIGGAVATYFGFGG